MADLELGREGILFLNTTHKLTGRVTSEPYYLIKRFSTQEQDIPMIGAFNLLPESVQLYKQTKDLKDLQPNYEEVTKIKRKFNPVTKFAKKFAESKGLNDTERVGSIKQFEKPIYISVVTSGNSTITGNYNDYGFYDKSASGESTGVFITFDDITWLDYKVTNKALLNYLEDYGDTYIKNLTGTNNLNTY